MNWQTQKLCTDINHYELVVERQKSSWHCEQRHESWRWSVAYHGAVVAQGQAPSEDDARVLAEKNVPVQGNS